MSTRSVLYVGNGEQFDNVNNIASRKWSGPGDIVVGVTQMQADRLCAFPEFEDVTDLTDKELAARVAKAQADGRQKKRESRQAGAQAAAAVQYATDDELREELRRREESAQVQKAGTAAEKKAAKSKKKKSDSPEKPKNTSELNDMIDEAIGQLITGGIEGVPTREDIEGVLGFQITEAEYDIALDGKQLADIPDKTGFSDGEE